jgi:hypothetical protein
VHHYLPLDHRRLTPRPRALSLSKTGVFQNNLSSRNL